METKAQIPEVPQFADANFRSIQGDFRCNANYERVLENVLDFAHAPFVHGKAFGNPDAPEVGGFGHGKLCGGCECDSHAQGKSTERIMGIFGKKGTTRYSDSHGVLFAKSNFSGGKSPFW